MRDLSLLEGAPDDGRTECPKYAEKTRKITIICKKFCILLVHLHIAIDARYIQRQTVGLVTSSKH